MPPTTRSDWWARRVPPSVVLVGDTSSCLFLNLNGWEHTLFREHLFCPLKDEGSVSSAAFSVVWTPALPPFQPSAAVCACARSSSGSEKIEILKFKTNEQSYYSYD